MTPARVTPIQILLVEDSESDIVLTQEVLKEAKVLNELAVARDGEEALRHARREGEFEGQSIPDLILLDLNLPRKDGREVLGDLKADPELHRIPIVVLTTSTRERDVLAAYDHHVNAYITKPVDLDQFVAVVKSIEEFWLSVVRLPQDGG